MLPNRNFERRSSRERGSALVLAVLLVMVMTVLGLGLVFVSEVERDIAIHDQQAKIAREIARSALTHAKFRFIEALLDGEASNDLQGTPSGATALPAKYLCINDVAFAKDECRGCLRTVDFGQCLASDQRMQAVPLYDYVEGVYLIKRPYLDQSNPFDTPMGHGPAVKGYVSIWIRNNPNDVDPTDEKLPGTAGTDVDEDVVLIAEVWIKKYPEPFVHWLNALDEEAAARGTAENPIVARVVMAEFVTKKKTPLLAYSGRNIDLHNTNTLYAYES